MAHSATVMGASAWAQRSHSVYPPPDGANGEMAKAAGAAAASVAARAARAATSAERRARCTSASASTNASPNRAAAGRRPLGEDWVGSGFVVSCFARPRGMCFTFSKVFALDISRSRRRSPTNLLLLRVPSNPAEPASRVTLLLFRVSPAARKESVRVAAAEVALARASGTVVFRVCSLASSVAATAAVAVAAAAERAGGAAVVFV
mmetsp:Transcript_29769/g.74893  ORF Transcript_29769/g.74893 Transcript_29769/m.74893 type:complete len:206 (+) Transcript_29769:435-1052(+)